MHEAEEELPDVLEDAAGEAVGEIGREEPGAVVRVGGEGDGEEAGLADGELRAAGLREDGGGVGGGGEEGEPGGADDYRFGDVERVVVAAGAGEDGVDVVGAARVEVAAHVHVAVAEDFGGAELADHGRGVGVLQVVVVPG